MIFPELASNTCGTGARVHSSLARSGRWRQVWARHPPTLDVLHGPPCVLQEPRSEDEADPAEFHAVLHEERQAALEGAEETASAEGEEGAERDTGAQGA